MTILPVMKPKLNEALIVPEAYNAFASLTDILCYNIVTDGAWNTDTLVNQYKKRISTVDFGSVLDHLMKTLFVRELEYAWEIAQTAMSNSLGVLALDHIRKSEFELALVLVMEVEGCEIVQANEVCKTIARYHKLKWEYDLGAISK